MCIRDSSHRGLLLMVGQRRSMLEYLKRIDIERDRALVDVYKRQA